MARGKKIYMVEETEAQIVSPLEGTPVVLEKDWLLLRAPWNLFMESLYHRIEELPESTKWSEQRWNKKRKGSRRAYFRFDRKKYHRCGTVVTNSGKVRKRCKTCDAEIPEALRVLFELERKNV